MPHEHEHSHDHDHEHEHGHDHEHAHEHGAAPRGHGPTGGEPGVGSTAAVDRERLLILLRNWVDHNEGHRRSYLEWRDRLAGEGLPVTTAAMERLADLADEANTALRGALDELGAK